MKRFFHFFVPAVVIAAIALVIEVFGFNYRAFESYTYPAANKVVLNKNTVDTYVDLPRANDSSASDEISHVDDSSEEEEPYTASLEGFSLFGYDKDYHIEDFIKLPSELSSPGSYSIVYPEGTTINDDGYVSFAESTEPEVMVIANELDARNIYIDAGRIDSEDLETWEKDGIEEKFSIRMAASDAGNFYFYDLPQVKIYSEEPDTNYFKLELYGNLRLLKISFPDVDKSQMYIHDISLNVRRPFMFNLLRFACVLILLALAFILRPASSVWRSTYSLKNNSHLAIVLFLLFGQLALIANTTSIAIKRYNPDIEHHEQYHKLAVALTEGHFYLEDEPSEALVNMKNPYDRYARRYNDVSFIWDTAYYNGKYYCYFGILPVLTFYLPYYLATGEAFPTYIAIIFNLCVCAIALILLLDELLNQSFKKASLGEFLVLDAGLFSASAIMVGAQTPTFYTVPISMGLMFALLGLYFWLLARANYRALYIVTGAACLALTAACRPQFALSSFLVFPLLGSETLKRLRTPSDPKERKTTISTIIKALLPYVIVAGFLMYYNYARFGSPFDFGANYNLTTNDMTHRGFKLDRLPFGIFTYLLQLPVFTGLRPYLYHVTVLTHYQGLTVFETMYGGLIWFAPVILCILIAAKKDIRQRIKDKKLGFFSLLCLCSGIVIMCIDIQSAGILMRYYMDFGLYLCIPGAICALAAGEAARENEEAAEAASKKSGIAVKQDSISVHASVLFACAAAMIILWGLWNYRFL